MLRNYPAYFPQEEKQFTVEIYKRDGRRKSGNYLVKKYDLSVAVTQESADAHVAIIGHHNYPAHKGYYVELHETFVTRKNLLSGEEFKERYDTPVYCSPSSESFWSN